MTKGQKPLRHFIFVCFLCILTACNVPPYDSEAHQDHAMNAPNFKLIKHGIGPQTIAGAVGGETCNPAVLFIHGAPGDWSAWGDYFQDEDLNENGFLIALDRPGYGGSNKGKWEASLEKQSDVLIKAALKEHPGPFIVVGHSFGGPVAFQMAMDHPDHVAEMVLLAGSVDPALEETKWFQYVADSFFIKWLVPSALNVANQEILPLRYELDKQTSRLPEIKQNTLIIQGLEDTLVPPGNADYAKRKLLNAKVEVIKIEGQGHFLPWREYDLVRGEIFKRIEGKGACDYRNEK